MRSGGAEAAGPVGPHQVVVAADAAGAHQHRLGAELEAVGDVAVGRAAALGAVGCQDGAAHAGHRPAGHHQRVDAVAESSSSRPAAWALRTRRTNGSSTRAGAPRDVEARHRVAVPAGTAVAALGPADDREEPHALLVQPRALLAGGEVDVGLGPLARPVVLGPVEAGTALPVLPRQLDRVADPHPPLLGTVHQEEPAERPVGPPRFASLSWSSTTTRRPGVGELSSGHEPGQPGSHDDDIGVHEPRENGVLPRAVRARRWSEARAGRGCGGGTAGRARSGAG